MRRLAPFVLALLLASACGGSEDARPNTTGPADTKEVAPTTSVADPGEAAPRSVGGQSVCQAYGDWLGAVAFGGPAERPADRINAVVGSLEDPLRSQLTAAVGSSSIDFGAAAEVDLATMAQCGFPLAEGAFVAASNGAPDCYLDANRDIIVDMVCEFGGRPITVPVPALSDAGFCGTAQEFVRSGARSLTGQAAIDELNRFVDAAPTEVERVLRDIVSATSSGDTEDQVRALFALDRLVAAGCGDAVANDYLSLVVAAIDAVPPPSATPAPGQPADDDPGTVAGGSPFVTLCQGIERRFAGSSAREWGLVLDIAVSVSAPSDVIDILSQLANPDLEGEEARAPLVASLQPFLDGPCQDTGLDSASGGGPADPDEEGENEDEEQGIPDLL